MAGPLVANAMRRAGKTPEQIAVACSNGMNTNYSCGDSPKGDADKFAGQIQGALDWATRYANDFMDPKKAAACKKIASALKSAMSALKAFPAD